MADDGPPPLQGSDDEELEYVGTSSGSGEESGGDSEEEEEEDDNGGKDAEEEEEESDDEAPPPMWGDSGSEPEEAVPPPRPPPKAGAKKTTPAAAAAAKKADATGGGKSTSSAANGKSRTKPPTAAETLKKTKVGRQNKNKDACVPPLWTAFEKSREGADRLGITPLKKWEAFVKEGIPASFTNWYLDQVLGNRSVPQALRIEGLASGFPEFCHWVAAGHHTSSALPVEQADGTKAEGQFLKAGFEPFAKTYVKRVEEDDFGPPAPVARTSPPPPRAAGAGAGGGAGGRGGAAPVSEPISGGGGGVDPRARKRDRRARRGGAAANGTLAQKMQSAIAITELEGFDAGDDEGSAAATAVRAGHQAEDEARDLLRKGDFLEDVAGVLEDAAADQLGPAFADSRLPHGTLTMLSHLKRAREYRRRANRQHECLESELERCLSRLARVEAQYLALVAETSGQEATLESCLGKAGPLIDEAFALVEKGSPAQALGGYDDAIKLLEVHVEKAPAPSAGESESPEHYKARQLLGTALCNRSVASYLLGDAYSGKRDAERAAAECPGAMAQKQLKRSQEYQRTLTNTNAASQWTAFASPP